MALLQGIKASQQSASAARPHILFFGTARSVSDDSLFEVWNGPTDAAKVVRVNKDGQFQLQAGTVSAPALVAEADKDTGVYFVTATPEVAIAIAGAKVFSVVAAGVVAKGYVIDQSSSGIVRMNTEDGSDSAALIVTGGGTGSSGPSRGGLVATYGNEHPTAPGEVHVQAGTPGYVKIVSGSRELHVTDDAVIANGPLYIDSAAGSISLNTDDGADTGLLTISGGGNGGTGTGRGGHVKLYGVEHATKAGDVDLIPGSGGAVQVSGDLIVTGALNHDGSTLGFYGATPTSKQVGVAVSAAGIHAALVNLGLIAA